jgi:tetratricopeptide (TPR) repeat protein
MNIGSLKNDQKQYEAAKMQFKEALVYANEIGDLELISDCNSNIGTNFINLNNLDSALIYLEEGLKLREMIDNELEKINSYNNLAHLHILKKEFEKAKNYLDLSQTICDKYEYPEAKVELYGTLSFYYEAQKQFESALILQKKQVALNDSLQKIDKENSQLQFFDEEQAIIKTSDRDVYKPWLYVIIGLLSIIIVALIIKRKK